MKKSIHLKNFVIFKGMEFCVDSCFTFDRGFETMIFKAKDGKIINWTDLYVEHYDSENAMIAGHDYIVNHLDKILKE